MSFKGIQDNNIRERLFTKFLLAYNKSKLVSYL
jgi:hypothetical protein